MKEEKHMLSIFAKPVSCAFVVAPEKAEAFLHEKSDPKNKGKNIKTCQKTRGTDEKNAENNPVREPNSNQ
ncbi:MAG: hypothetical protein ACLSFT_11865 [Ruminococcus callidus]